MKKPHLLARCLEPVAMTEQSLRVCIAIASDDAFFADDRAKALDAAGGPMALALGEPRAPMVIENGVATIAIEGTLVRKASGISAVSGLTSYADVRKDLRAALADPSVRSLTFAIDSPGGEVSGLFELADEIYAARSGPKPLRADVVAANSAAYVLAAAAGNISIEQMGEAGSVGVIAGVRRPDATGDDAIYFVSSVSPNKRPDVSTDEGRAVYQSRVDYAGERLIEKVAFYRGVTPEAARANFGAGAVLLGAQAVAAGLVDRVGVAPAATARPSRVAARAATRSPKMADPAAPVPPDDKPVEPAAADAMKCAGCSADAADPMYCATCAGKGEAPADPMPAAKATRLFGVLGATNVDAALGIAAAAMEAHRALPAALAKIAALESDGNRRQLRATLEQGIADKRLNLGRIRAAVVEQLAALDEGKGKAIVAALSALDETKAGEASAVLDAVCSVDPGAAGLRIVAAYCKSATPTHNEPAVEPVDDPARAAAHDAEIGAVSQSIASVAKRTREHFAKSTPAPAK